MMFRTMILYSITILLAGSLGCATMMAQDKERQLSAAGFQMKMADTADKESHLAGLEQRKLFPTKMQGDLVYVYADTKGCNCMYVGSEADYQRYQRIAMLEREVDEERDTAELNEDSMEWGTWGDWNRPIY
jgi:hypothetical protein